MTMIVKQYDTVLLKNGQIVTIVEVLNNESLIVDDGGSPED